MSDHRLVVAFAVGLGLAPGCGSKKDDAPKPEAQSFREALEIICGAGERPELANVNPAERQMRISSWIHDQLRNPEAIALFGKMGDASPAERAAVVEDALRRAGLTACVLLEPNDPFASVDLSEVGDLKLDPLTMTSLMIATRTAVVVEGTEVAPIRDGRLEGDRLSKFLAALRASPSGGGGLLTVVVDASTPFGLFVELLAAARPAYRSFQIVARHATGVGAILLELPDAAPQPGGLGVVISLTATELRIWSTSGTEGTLERPLAAIPMVEPAAACLLVQRTLADIRSRHPGERRLILMADRRLPMATVAPAMAAARRTPDGARLFDDLVLGMGFE